MGYGITAICDQEFGSWRYSYHAQAGIYLILFFMFLAIPRKYIEDFSQEENTQESESLSDNPREIKEEISGLEDEFTSKIEEDDSGYS